VEAEGRGQGRERTDGKEREEAKTLDLSNFNYQPKTWFWSLGRAIRAGVSNQSRSPVGIGLKGLLTPFRSTHCPPFSLQFNLTK